MATATQEKGRSEVRPLRLLSREPSVYPGSEPGEVFGVVDVRRPGRQPQALVDGYGLGFLFATIAAALATFLATWLAMTGHCALAAMRDGEIVGYSGLCRIPGEPDTAEDGLTVRATGERRYHKRIHIPVKVRPDSAKATFKNGILDVTLRRAEGQDPGHKVAIE